MSTSTSLVRRESTGGSPVRTGGSSASNKRPTNRPPTGRRKDDAQEHRCCGDRRRGHLGRDRRGRRARPGERDCVEPSRGAAHRGRPLGGPHRRLCVPQPRPTGHRHDPRERDPRRGPRGRAELVHVLARRALQPEDRHDGRRPPRRHLPVRVPAQDRPVLPRRHGPAVHRHPHRQGQDDGRRERHDAAEQHRPAVDAGLPEPRREVDSSRSTAAPRRRSPGSATIRSSATSGRSSTSSRSARAPETWAEGRTSSPATASTRSPSSCRSPA